LAEKGLRSRNQHPFEDGRGSTVGYWIYAPQDRKEEVLGRFGANLFRGIEAMQGHVTITSRRLLFESHVGNVEKAPIAIPLWGAASSSHNAVNQLLKSVVR